jgi:serine phosphatase RsbU (regulator of sigma subunit)
MFTEARLAEVLKAHGEGPLDGLVRAVGDAVSTFIGDAPPFDDITGLAVRRVS